MHVVIDAHVCDCKDLGLDNVLKYNLLLKRT